MNKTTVPGNQKAIKPKPKEVISHKKGLRSTPTKEISTA
jgi:hypothetical protein